MDIRWKNWVPPVPLFDVTEDHRNWHVSIRYLWLPINVPYGPTLYHFPVMARYCRSFYRQGNGI